MKRFLLLLLAVTPLACLAQDIPPPDSPQVQVAEVLRRGDTVTSCGEGPRSGAEVAFAAAMAPPQKDCHLWDVTLWTAPGCQACEHLKSDFRKAPELLAFVAPPSPNALPWAKYREYSSADATQTDRRLKYLVTKYPTLIIQPPRNGMWGDPGLIVAYEVGYSGDSKKLAATIQAKVRFFAEVQSKKGFPVEPKPLPQALPPPDVVEPMGGNQGAGAWQTFTPPDGFQLVRMPLAQVAATPSPFPAPPAVDPFNPQPPSVTTTPVQWPPAPAPAPTPPAANGLDALKLLLPLIGMVLPSGQTLTWVSVLILVGLKVWEVRAKKTVTQLDDQAIAFIRSVLSGQAPTPPQIQAAQGLTAPPAAVQSSSSSRT